MSAVAPGGRVLIQCNRCNTVKGSCSLGLTRAKCTYCGGTEFFLLDPITRKKIPGGAQTGLQILKSNYSPAEVRKCLSCGGSR